LIKTSAFIQLEWASIFLTELKFTELNNSMSPLYNPQANNFFYVDEAKTYTYDFKETQFI